MAQSLVETLGLWSDDPRSVAGARALDSMQGRNTRVKTESRDGLVPDLDPRVVATKAETAYRQSPLGHVETVIKSTITRTPMTRGQGYSMK